MITRSHLLLSSSMIIFLRETIFIFYLCTTYIHGYSNWIHEHYECVTELQFGSLMPKGTVTSYSRCVEARYMEFVRLRYNRTSDKFTKSILSAVINLYKELENVRKPTEISVANLGTNHSLLVYPISFAIPEQYVLKTVPPKNKGKT